MGCTQQLFSPRSGSRSQLLRCCKASPAPDRDTLLDQQVYGVYRFPQSLPMPGLEVAIHGRQFCEPTSRAKNDRCGVMAPMVIPRLLLVYCQHLGRGDQPWNPLGFRRRSVGSRGFGGWEDVSFRPCQMLEQVIHIQIRHASQADTICNLEE